MTPRIHESWKTALQSEWDQAYLQTLSLFLREAYQNSVVYPTPSEIFTAFDLCPFDQVRVVILGQDPYHGAGQAHGLAFSVKDGVTIPPSLRNIFLELENDLGIAPAVHGNLSRWAQQGVLLLNSLLTVEADQPGSHKGKGWETFTDAVIRVLSEQKTGLVFVLWGNYAAQKGEAIDRNKHLVLQAAHPSPFSASRFFGCGHFHLINDFFLSRCEAPIDWDLSSHEE